MTTQLIAEGAFFLNDLHISQDQLDMLDLSFLDEDIPIADGIFHLPPKDKEFAEDCRLSDDESTVDLTDSSHSSYSNGIGISLLDDSMHDDDQQSSNFRSFVLEGDSQKVTDEDDSTNNHGDSQEQPPANSRPRLATTLRNSFRRSFKSFKIKETDDTKQRIKAAALRAKIRQQKLRNALLAEQLEQSKEQARDLQVAIHEITTTASDEYLKCIIEADDEADERVLVKASIERMRAEKAAVDSKREQFAKEAAEIRKMLDSNADRLEILRQERNEQATQRLNLELFLVRAGIPDGAETLLASEKALRVEVNELRAKLGLSSSESGGEESQNTMGSIEQQQKEEQRIEVLQTLSEKAVELQTDRYDLLQTVSNLRHLLGQLKATKAKQEANIEALEHNFLALTEDELHTLDVMAERAAAAKTQQPPRRRRLGRLLGRRR